MEEIIKKDIKAIFLDMDGTTLDENGQVTKELKSTIKKLVERGILVHLASGRSFESMLPTYNTLNLTTLIIAYNGAKLINSKGEIIKEKKLLNPILVRDAVRIAKKNDVLIQFYINNIPYYSGSDEIAIEYQAKSGTKSYRLEEMQDYYNLCSNGMFLVSEINCNNERLLACLKEISTLKQWKEHGSVFFSSEGTLEFCNIGTSKGDMISNVLHSLDINHENTIAIGDGLNDLEMISNAGLGVAMGNALDELKVISDITILKNTDNGVSKFLNNYFGLI